MSDIKLTKAQRDWLEKIEHGALSISPLYPPHVKLVANGLIVDEPPGKFGFVYSTISSAGRAWLAEHPRKQ